MSKLIPDIKTDYEHNSLNVYVSYEQLQKQTEQLNKLADNLYQTITEYKALGWGTSDEQMTRWIELIEEITGMTLDEIKREYKG